MLGFMKIQCGKLSPGEVTPEILGKQKDQLVPDRSPESVYHWKY